MILGSICHKYSDIKFRMWIYKEVQYQIDSVGKVASIRHLSYIRRCKCILYRGDNDIRLYADGVVKLRDDDYKTGLQSNMNSDLTSLLRAGEFCGGQGPRIKPTMSETMLCVIG